MTVQRTERNEEIFAAARALAAPQRAEFLDRACAGDRALREEIKQRLQTDSLEFEATEAIDANNQTGTAGDDRHVGRVIGVWRLLGPLGSGGMGTVFLAERMDGAYRTRAALKMLNPWLLGSGFERRFAMERQILADLKHPAIAHLLDGGVTSDGVPYLVLEYVEGVPINRHAQQYRLDIEQRLRLFLKVCHAVQYAHQNLIVHRDLKPGNLLVTEHGDPKLLDFGIAKMLVPGAIGDNPEGAQATQMLTPEYASPEQLRGAPVTTASDIYSLGVILYLLLAGQRPPTGPDSDTVPLTKPSAAFARGKGTSLESLPAAQRSRWAKILRGDLDTITLKALAFEPARRYATAQQLADDIERYLRRQPVMARPDAASYRLGKFVQRHPFGVGFAVIALGLILAAAIGLELQAVQLRAERDRATREQLRAEREATSASKISDFLLDLFNGANPQRASGTVPTLREVLDRGVQRIGSELASEPLVQAKLMNAMADAYRQLGAYDAGLPLATRALELRQTQLPPTAAEITQSMDSLGELQRSVGKYEAAAETHRRSLALREQADPPDPASVAQSLNNLALTLEQNGQYAEALPLFQRALKLRREYADPNSQAALSTLINIGILQRNLGNLQDAENAFEEVIRRRVATLGEEHMSTANAVNQLSRVLRLEGKYEAAERLARRALAVRRKVLGENHPDVAGSLADLGAALQPQGKVAEAETLYRQSIAMDEQLLGRDHPEASATVIRLASVLMQEGALVEAEPLLRRALSLRQNGFSSDHPQIAFAQTRLADLLVLRRRFDEAETLYSAALDLQQRKLPSQHPDIGLTVFGQARLALARGENQLGRERLAKALQILRAGTPEADVDRRSAERLAQSLGLLAPAN